MLWFIVVDRSPESRQQNNVSRLDTLEYPSFVPLTVDWCLNDMLRLLLDSYTGGH